MNQNENNLINVDDMIPLNRDNVNVYGYPNLFNKNYDPVEIMALGNHANVTKDRSSAIGNHCITSAEDSVAIGNHADVSGVQSVAIGYKSSVKHENCVVIGNNEESIMPDSVQINGHTFLHDQLHIGEDIVVYSQNQNTDITCDACCELLSSGLQWDVDVSSNNNSVSPEDASVPLPYFSARICLNCIRDTVMQFKAKESWIAHTGSNPEPTTMELKREIEAIKEQLKQIKNESNENKS